MKKNEGFVQGKVRRQLESLASVLYKKTDVSKRLKKEINAALEEGLSNAKTLHDVDVLTQAVLGFFAPMIGMQMHSIGDEKMRQLAVGLVISDRINCIKSLDAHASTFETMMFLRYAILEFHAKEFADAVGEEVAREVIKAFVVHAGEDVKTTPAAYDVFESISSSLFSLHALLAKGMFFDFEGDVADYDFDTAIRTFIQNIMLPTLKEVVKNAGKEGNDALYN